MKTIVHFEAIHLVALHIDMLAKKPGTPEHAKAVKLYEDGKKLWREQSKKKCPHCGKDL